MSMLRQVVTGAVAEPARLLVYGPDKVGKSTFGAAWPNPVFADVEGKAGTLRPAPARIHLTDYQAVLQLVGELTHGDHDYQTFVLDSLDWLEPLVWKHVVARAVKVEMKKIKSIEDVGGGYKKGYTEANDVWRSFLSSLEQLQRKRGMHIVLLAHSAVKTHKDPHGGDYGRIRTSLYGSSEDVVMQWTKAACYASFEEAKTKNGKLTRRYGYGQARFLFTNWHPAYRAGNNYDLPDRLPLDPSPFLRALHVDPPVDPKVLEAIEERLEFLPEEFSRSARAYAAEHKASQSRLCALLARINAKLNEDDDDPTPWPTPEPSPEPEAKRETERDMKPEKSVRRGTPPVRTDYQSRQERKARKEVEEKRHRQAMEQQAQDGPRPEDMHGACDGMGGSDFPSPEEEQREAERIERTRRAERDSAKAAAPRGSFCAVCAGADPLNEGLPNGGHTCGMSSEREPQKPGLVECTHCSEIRRRPIRHAPPQCEAAPKRRKRRSIGSPRS